MITGAQAEPADSRRAARDARDPLRPHAHRHRLPAVVDVVIDQNALAPVVYKKS